MKEYDYLLYKKCKKAVSQKNPTISLEFLAHFPMLQLCCLFAFWRASLCQSFLEGACIFTNFTTILEIFAQISAFCGKSAKFLRIWKLLESLKKQTCNIIIAQENPAQMWQILLIFIQQLISIFPFQHEKLSTLVFFFISIQPPIPYPLYLSYFCILGPTCNTTKRNNMTWIQITKKAT